MEKENETVADTTTRNETENREERLKALAEKNKKTVDEFLESLEERQAVITQNDLAKNRSIGSQMGENNFDFDPTGSEFLKGIWGK